MIPALIPAIVSMLGSAALSYGMQSSMAKKQQAAAAAARQRQIAAQNEATREAASKAAEFDPNLRRQQQGEIEQALTTELEQQASKPITAQGVQVGATIPGAPTADYTVAKAKEAAKTTASLRELAALMGRIGSASQLRQREAIGIGDTAGAIGRIQNGTNNMGQIDQIGIDVAGRPSLGMSLASEALRAYGGTAMAGAFGGGAPAPKFPEYGIPSGPTGAWL